jgi:hypothetical protein
MAFGDGLPLGQLRWLHHTAPQELHFTCRGFRHTSSSLGVLQGVRNRAYLLCDHRQKQGHNSSGHFDKGGKVEVANTDRPEKQIVGVGAAVDDNHQRLCQPRAERAHIHRFGRVDIDVEWDL